MCKIRSIIQAFLILVVSKEHIKRGFFFPPKPKLLGINPLKHTYVVILNPTNSRIVSTRLNSCWNARLHQASKIMSIQFRGLLAFYGHSR